MFVRKRADVSARTIQMVTRRQTTIGLVSVALGSAVVSSASFLSDTAAAADLRVVVTSELTLTPAGPNEEHVNTDADGEVEEIVIEQLNQRSVSRFEEVVEVTNNGDVGYDRLAFEFTSPDGGTGPSADVADTLRVISPDHSTGTDGQGRTTLLDGAGEELAPGDAVTFGLVVNLIASSSPGDLDDLPDAPTVTLEITAIEE